MSIVDTETGLERSDDEKLQLLNEAVGKIKKTMKIALQDRIKKVRMVGIMGSRKVKLGGFTFQLRRDDDYFLDVLEGPGLQDELTFGIDYPKKNTISLNVSGQTIATLTYKDDIARSGAFVEFERVFPLIAKIAELLDAYGSELEVSNKTDMPDPDLERGAVLERIGKLDI